MIPLIPLIPLSASVVLVLVQLLVQRWKTRRRPISLKKNNP